MAGPRVGVSRVCTRHLGQDADDGNQESGDQEFHAVILRSGLDESNLLWFHD